MNVSAPDSIHVERLQQAADWLIRLRESPRDEALVAEWLDWCDADPANLTAFEKIKAVWLASAEDVAPARFRPSPRRASLRLPLSLAAVGTLAMAAVLWPFLGPDPAPSQQVLATPVAMHSDSVLEDGSRVTLGALSRISTRFSEEERLVAVEAGEAFFTVAGDPSRPFIVQAGAVRVIALGTAFNVRRSVERVVVTVAEGRVGVIPPAEGGSAIASSTPRPGGRGQSVRVEAGQQLSYSESERRVAVATVDPSLATSWRQGVFKYVREPLADVVADLNRYTTRRIVIADDELGTQRYTGTVFGGRIDDWLQALEDVFPVRVVESPEQTVLEPRERPQDSPPADSS